MRVLAHFPGPEPVVVFRVEGMLDEAASRLLERRLVDLGRRYPIVCLDLRGLGQLNAEAAQTITDSQARARAHGWRLVALGTPSGPCLATPGAGAAQPPDTSPAQRESEPLQQREPS